jgi:sugar (pentulose or hexulose) kinase
MLADALDITVEVTDATEAGARGAALLGGLAAGTYRSYGDMPQAARTAFTEDSRSVADKDRIDPPVKGEA